MDTSTKQVPVMSDLFCVISGIRTFIGRYTGASNPVVDFNFELLSALEVRAQQEQDESGQIRTMIALSPIIPCAGPITVHIKPDAVFQPDDPNLIEHYSRLIGRATLVVPAWHP